MSQNIKILLITSLSPTNWVWTGIETPLDICVDFQLSQIHNFSGKFRIFSMLGRLLRRKTKRKKEKKTQKVI